MSAPPWHREHWLEAGDGRTAGDGSPLAQGTLTGLHIALAGTVCSDSLGPGWFFS